MQILGPQFGGPPYGPEFFPDASQAPSYGSMVLMQGGTVFIFCLDHSFIANLVCNHQVLIVLKTLNLVLIQFAF